MIDFSVYAMVYLIGVCVFCVIFSYDGCGKYNGDDWDRAIIITAIWPIVIAFICTCLIIAPIKLLIHSFNHSFKNR